MDWRRADGFETTRRRRDARGAGDDVAGDDAIGVRGRRPAERADVGGARERNIQRGERDGDERGARDERKREGRASARVERDANVLREGWIRERGRTGAGDGADGWWGDRRTNGAARRRRRRAVREGRDERRGARTRGTRSRATAKRRARWATGRSRSRRWRGVAFRRRRAFAKVSLAVSAARRSLRARVETR